MRLTKCSQESVLSEEKPEVSRIRGIPNPEKGGEGKGKGGGLRKP